MIAHSERPLKPEELCHALGVELGSNDESSDNIPSIRTILTCGLGLVTIDSLSSTVRLVHFTLQEYILANSTLFHSPHSAISEVCLTYLNFESKSLSPALRSSPPETPFLEYASCFWGTHARREISESVISLALDLLNRFDTHVSCKALLRNYYSWQGPFDIEGNPIGFTGLHGAAALGVMEILVSLFEAKKWDINATDFRGETALMLAAMEGHDEVVRMLLEKEGINPDMTSKGGQTALSWAADNGHEGIVKILLGRSDVSPDRVDNWGKTPLSQAAFCGHGGVAELLLDLSDVNPNWLDKWGQTPLFLAAIGGNEEIVRMLLVRGDVNLNTVDECGETPLFVAASSGYKDIVAMLLERRDVNPNMADCRGKTSLCSAAKHGREEIVKMLLERGDVNPDTEDDTRAKVAACQLQPPKFRWLSFWGHSS